ncbi:MAG: helix-hairpin-helix domain-containing protein [Candidatus Hodarchaeales archaeon]
MDLEAITVDKLHPKDLFFDPATHILYIFKGRKGSRGSLKTSQTIIVSQFTTQNITELQFKGGKTLLKLTGELPQYQVLEFRDNSVSLFDFETGEIFELSSSHLLDEVKAAEEAYNSGKEINAEIIEYEEQKILYRLAFEKPSLPTQVKEIEKKIESPSDSSSNDISAHVKEIEARKAKRRKYTPTTGTVKQTARTPTSKKKIAKPSKTTAQKAKKTKQKIPTLIDQKKPQLKGMGVKTLETLHNRFNINTLEDLTNADPSELSQIPRISRSKVEEWIKQAKQLLKT